jgi:hypothetical protein
LIVEHNDEALGVGEMELDIVEYIFLNLRNHFCMHHTCALILARKETISGDGRGGLQPAAAREEWTLGGTRDVWSAK